MVPLNASLAQKTARPTSPDGLDRLSSREHANIFRSDDCAGCTRAVRAGGDGIADTRLADVLARIKDHEIADLASQQRRYPRQKIGRASQPPSACATPDRDLHRTVTTKLPDRKKPWRCLHVM